MISLKLNQKLTVGKTLLGLLATVLGLGGCSVAQLQAGLEKPPVELIQSASVQGENSIPKAIESYPSFQVDVEEGVTVNVYTRQSKEAKANIFLIHGAGSGAWAWEYFFESLPQQYNLYALSWRGHFDSSPVIDARASDYIRDQEAVMKAIRKANALPIHMIGHSYGGATSVLQAANSTHEIASISLLAPVVPLDYTLSQKLIVPLIAPYFIKKDAEKGNQEDGVYGGMFVSKSRMHHYYEAHASKTYSTEKPSLIAVDGVSPDWQRQLERAYENVGKMQIPLLLVISKYDNVVVPRRQVRTGTLNGFETFYLDSGHYIPLDVEVSSAIDLVTRNLEGALFRSKISAIDTSMVIQ